MLGAFCLAQFVFVWTAVVGAESFPKLLQSYLVILRLDLFLVGLITCSTTFTKAHCMVVIAIVLVLSRQKLSTAFPIGVFVLAIQLEFGAAFLASHLHVVETLPLTGLAVAALARVLASPGNTETLSTFSGTIALRGSGGECAGAESFILLDCHLPLP
jgi:hypothetical protein